LNVGDSLPVVEKGVTLEQVEQYARASGDFNPIHMDADFAAGAQFGTRIVHGMMVAATISEMMTSAFGGAWLNTGRMKIRFKSPVYPGDRITALGRVKSVRETEGGSEIACSVQITRGSGEVAITGDTTVTVSGDGGPGA
jgi:acyl dehydratase